MKKRIFIANVALLLVADIALTGYILNKRNKFNDEVPVFTKPTISQEQTVSTEQTELDYIIEETEVPEVTEEPVIEETKEIIKPPHGSVSVRRFFAKILFHLRLCLAKKANTII